jgi:alkanesulfonate monooxygenase SsuD/methylene tetrahydromethanopterin reductase-like flavin-dependent oxidoreductase (luciferase family)
MFQLAGEIADGVLNNEGLVTPQYFEWVRTNLAKGAERAGRKASEVDLAAYLFVSIADEHDEAKERIKPSIVGMLAQGALTPHLERLGTSLAEMTPLLNACKEGDTRGACKLVTDKILQATCVYGTPSECKRQMRSFRNAGVKLPIILPVGDWTKTIRLAKDW